MPSESNSTRESDDQDLVGSPSREQLSRWRRETSDASARELLEWAIGRWGGEIAMVTSFQAEGLVILDLIRRELRASEVRVITLDTGRLPQETHDLMDEVRDRYGVDVEVFLPDPEAVAALVRNGGANSFYNSADDRQACCQARKVEPLRRALSGLSGWITGLRRDQSASRATVEPLEIDHKHGGLLKLNPLAHWTWAEVWEHIERHRVPYNALYDRGYTSIGCAPCTRPIRPGQDPRAGRWWWEKESEHKECGLHLPIVGQEATGWRRQEARA